MTVQAVKKPWLWLAQNCKRYVPVAYYMAVAQAKHEFAGTFGGILWWFGEPVIYTLIYYFVFAVVFNAHVENFIAFLMLGLVTWRWFSRAITSAATSVARGSPLMRQVDIPKVIFPLESVIVESYKFLVALAVTMAGLMLAGSLAYQTLYTLPLVFIVSFMLLLGTGLVTSAIVPFFPDLKNIIPLFFRGLIFLSGVFYQIEQVPEAYRSYFYLNPLAHLIEAFRDVMLFGQMPDFRALLVIGLLSALICTAGLYIHWRYNRVFARYLL